MTIQRKLLIAGWLFLLVAWVCWYILGPGAAIPLTLAAVVCHAIGLALLRRVVRTASLRRSVRWWLQRGARQ